MDKVGVTLFDIVGYSIPGYICMLSAASFITLLTGNTFPLTALHNVNIFWQISCSYVLGHIVQAGVSCLWKYDYGSYIRNIGAKRESLDKYLTVVSSKMAVDVESIGHYEVLMSENFIKSESSNSKINIFRAFQGMNKGIMGVFFIVQAQILILMFASPSYEVHHGDQYCIITRSMLALFFVIIAVMMWLVKVRHDAFVRSRLRIIVANSIGTNE